MKRMVMSVFLLCFFILSAFPQDSYNIPENDYLKRIEYNYVAGGRDFYNLKSKGDMEKLLLGDFNAPVEFFYDPPHPPQNEVPSSLRLVKGSSSWNLEVKYISNFKDVNEEMKKKYPTIDTPLKIPLPTTEEEREEVRKQIEHNAAVRAQRKEESLALYKADALLFSISNQFAEQLYEKMVWLIVNFKGKGIPWIGFGGYNVSFRTIIDDEVWSLWIWCPQRNALKMDDLCRQIISDARANELNESKYITVLNSFAN